MDKIVLGLTRIATIVDYHFPRSLYKDRHLVINHPPFRY